MPTDLKQDILEALVEERRAGRRTVMATVVAVRGSVPQAVGARMLVMADGTIRGTVGGGQREAEVIAAAKELHRWGGAKLLSVDFEEGAAAGGGPICGGSMEVFVETVDPAQRVLIAGAGHVGYFLHRVLALLDIRTIVLDPRPEMATPERFPGATIAVRPFSGGLEEFGLGANDGVVIVTPEHGHDEVVLRAALATAAGYVGMIGSRRKVPAILGHLRRDGVGENQLARIHAPIGLDIGARTPAEIAVAIAAEIVASFRRR